MTREEAASVKTKYGHGWRILGAHQISVLQSEGQGFYLQVAMTPLVVLPDAGLYDGVTVEFVHALANAPQ